MSFADLPEFLERLEKDGDLVRVKAQVDPYLEITEIVDRVVRAGGPALLFENVKGSKLPLAMNVFGTTARMAKALGVDDLDEIGARIGDLLKPELPKGFAGLKDAMSKLGQLRDVPPKKVRKGDCQDVVVKGDKVDLMSLARIAHVARRRRLVLQPWPHAHEAPRDRSAQPRALPVAAARLAHRRDALADPQGLQRPSRGGRAARRAIAGGDRVRLRPGGDLRGFRAAAQSTSTSTCSRASCGKSGSRWSTA